MQALTKVSRTSVTIASRRIFIFERVILLIIEIGERRYGCVNIIMQLDGAMAKHKSTFGIECSSTECREDQIASCGSVNSLIGV